MEICKVTGHVWATKKDESLNGFKLMIVEYEYGNDSKAFVAVDFVGSGIGDRVLVTTGSSARVGNKDVPIDATIVGVIDTLEK